MEWKDHPQVQRTVNEKILVNLTSDHQLTLKDPEFFKSKIQMFNCAEEPHFKFVMNEFVTKNKVLIVIFDKKKNLTKFLKYFILKFANGTQYINDLDEVLRMNAGSLFPKCAEASPN